MDRPSRKAWRLIAALAAACSAAPTALSSFPGQRAYDEENVSAMVANSALLFTAEISSADTVCVGDQSRVYVQVESADSWWAFPPDDIPMRIVCVDLPGCAGMVDASRPTGFRPGQRYLFLCGRDWSWESHRFLDELYVPVQGLLCMTGPVDFEFCTGGYSFTFPDPGQALREACQTIALDRQMADADLVVVAKEFRVPGQEDPSRRVQMRDGTRCTVAKVVKGDQAPSSIEINLHGATDTGLGWSPMVSGPDVALLFLGRGDDGLALLHGAKSCFLLHDSVIYSNHGLPMGAKLDGHNIVGWSSSGILNPN